jgi:hypothetical protein
VGIAAHDRYLKSSGEIAHKRRTAFAHRVRALALGALQARIDATLADVDDSRDPYAAAQAVLRRFGVDDAVGAAPNSAPRAPGRPHVKGL